MLEDCTQHVDRDKTYVAKSYRTRGRSLKEFYENLELVMEQGEIPFESFFDICHCICETGVTMWCPKTGNVKSYGFKTMDGKYSMSSKNMHRALLMFLGKTVGVKELYTDRQIRRLKAIMRLLALPLKEKLDDVTLKGHIQWLE